MPPVVEAAAGEARRALRPWRHPPVGRGPAPERDETCASAPLCGGPGSAPVDDDPVQVRRDVALVAEPSRAPYSRQKDSWTTSSGSSSPSRTASRTSRGALAGTGRRSPARPHVAHVVPGRSGVSAPGICTRIPEGCCVRLTVGTGAEDLQRVADVAEAVFGGDPWPTAPPSDPPPRRCAPQDRHTRWWWWVVLHRR